MELRSVEVTAIGRRPIGSSPLIGPPHALPVEVHHQRRNDRLARPPFRPRVRPEDTQKAVLEQRRQPRVVARATGRHDGRRRRPDAVSFARLRIGRSRFTGQSCPVVVPAVVDGVARRRTVKRR